MEIEIPAILIFKMQGLAKWEWFKKILMCLIHMPCIPGLQCSKELSQWQPCALQTDVNCRSTIAAFVKNTINSMSFHLQLQSHVALQNLPKSSHEQAQPTISYVEEKEFVPRHNYCLLLRMNNLSTGKDDKHWLCLTQCSMQDHMLFVSILVITILNALLCYQMLRVLLCQARKRCQYLALLKWLDSVLCLGGSLRCTTCIQHVKTGHETHNSKQDISMSQNWILEAHATSQNKKPFILRVIINSLIQMRLSLTP